MCGQLNVTKSSTSWKSLISCGPVLRSPGFDLEFVLQTDISEYGKGAVLTQVNENGEEHPNAYFSRKLLKEVKYRTVEKECLAIRITVQALRVHLLGRPFAMQIDHHALEWLNHSTHIL